MNNKDEFEFDDVQGLIRFGYGKLTDTCFLLLNIQNAAAAKKWLQAAPVTNAIELKEAPKTALQIAFTYEGLRKLNITSVIKDSGDLNRFSDEFIFGMASDESRSRRIGDIDKNAPYHWDWGGNENNAPHMLLLMYADPKNSPVAEWRRVVEGKNFSKAFNVLRTLPTLDIGPAEAFGFNDGHSQPEIDWNQQQSKDPHKRYIYSNSLAIGEVILGYRNEYEQYTARPLIDPANDPIASSILPDAEDQSGLKDFGRNGTYLVLRELDQDVPGFWRFVDKASGSDSEKRERLAQAMIGRRRDGKPLSPLTKDEISGISAGDEMNHFDYKSDPLGQHCPFGAHIRRANPRTGDLPGTVTGFWSWLVKILGFGLNRPEEDLIASTRFHRLLRRGRSYGPRLDPEIAIKSDAPVADRGLQFICLVANIQRQFEFVQNAWIVSSKFAGLQQERDPILGHRQPLLNGDVTDQFHQPDPAGPMHKTYGLQQFISVRGGAYFFMPGLRALKYIASATSSTAEPATGREH